MRKFLFVTIIAVFIVALLFAIRPFAAGYIDLSFLELDFLDQGSSSETDQPENIIRLETATELSIVQGNSDQALQVLNETNVPIHFKLGHTHAHLTLEPREDALAPGSYRNITLHVDDLCPSGEIQLMVYLLAETDGESYGMEAVNLSFTVIPGDLQLEAEGGRIKALWNGAPAPDGVVIEYYGPDPEDEDEDTEIWQTWGETPNLDPPVHLDPGNYSFEFKALFGEVESEVETFNVTVE